MMEEFGSNCKFEEISIASVVAYGLGDMLRLGVKMDNPFPSPLSFIVQ